MKAKFIEFPLAGSARISEQDIKTPGAGDVLVEAEASLISCGTERHFLMNAPQYPFQPGYSLVGRIAAIGADAHDFKVGDRVFAIATHGSHVVCDQRFVFRIPDDMAAQDAVFASVAAMAIYAAGLARYRLGDPVMVIGQGLIGLLTTQILRLSGALPIIGIDIVDSRLKLSAQFGADFCFHANDKAGLDALLATLPGGGVAATIEFSGGGQALETAIHACRRRGRIVAGSLGNGEGQTDIYGLPFLKGLQLIGAYFNARPVHLRQVEATSPLEWPVRPYDGGYYTDNEVSTCGSDYAQFFTMVDLGRLDLSSLVNAVVPCDEAPEVFARLPKSDFLGVVIKWKN